MVKNSLGFASPAPPANSFKPEALANIDGIGINNLVILLRVSSEREQV